MSEAGKRLIGAAKEALEIARGTADPSTYKVHVPSSVDVRGIRKGLNMTQEEFGLFTGFGAARIKDWEQHRREPDAAARAFLTVIERNPQAVREALSVTGFADV